MTRLRHTLEEATQRLYHAGIDSASLDARWLLEAVTGLSPTDIFLRGDIDLRDEDVMIYGSLIERRLRREPVARILGQREFWGLAFRLNEATLEPRPDSETLIEAALDHLPRKAGPLRLLDLGTGTGCLLAALLHELPQATGVAVDDNPLALQGAEANFTALGLIDRVTLHRGTWGEGLTEKFDVVISNPPYLRDDEVRDLQPEVLHYDPPQALLAGPDGLADYRTITAQLPSLLRLGGLAILELGRGQGEAVSQMVAQHGLQKLEIRDDLGGIPRALVAKK